MLYFLYVASLSATLVGQSQVIPIAAKLPPTPMSKIECDKAKPLFELELTLIVTGIAAANNLGAYPDVRVECREWHGS
ncbi:MAG TPA: hypothetical protein VJL39_00075 [Candidatus Paceibacterota bacterium]